LNVICNSKVKAVGRKGRSLFFHVVYEDGDDEEMKISDLKGILVHEEQDPHMTGNTKHIAN
jgi:hypothetical protein